MAKASARLHLVLFTSLIALIAFSTPRAARAQEATSDDISLYVGSMLPNQVNGVDEILPVFGGRYGFGTKIGTLEAGGANSHAEGVDFTTISGSLRGDFDLGDGMSGLVYGGLDFNWYIPEGATERQSETGFHIGTGALMSVSENLSLRADLKFMGGPGTSLYLLLGVMFRSSSAQ
ncbi:MAG: hypothetical protein V4760_17585 [Bdellovibrionota bacterium]